MSSKPPRHLPYETRALVDNIPYGRVSTSKTHLVLRSGRLLHSKSCNRFQSVVDSAGKKRAAAEPQAVTKRRKENPETEYESSDYESDLDGVPKAPKTITLKLPDVAKLLDRPVQGLGKVVAGNETLTTKHTCKSGKITRSIRFLSIKGLFRVAGSVATDRAHELYDWAADLCAPSLQTVTTVGKSLSLFTAKIPGIYFLLVGKLGDVKTSMGLASSEPDSWLVVKAGKAVDLNDRLPDHRRECGNYPGATLTVKALMITERSELSTAENAIHAWLHGAGEKRHGPIRIPSPDFPPSSVHRRQRGVDCENMAMPRCLGHHFHPSATVTLKGQTGGGGGGGGDIWSAISIFARTSKLQRKAHQFADNCNERTIDCHIWKLFYDILDVEVERFLLH
ncbi:hypothetical protein HDU88_007325 [Geranomyces variabilis]|nr:hypothetical protein HDU88_007325 [Geranomyces variabilis]